MAHHRADFNGVLLGPVWTIPERRKVERKRFIWKVNIHEMRCSVSSYLSNHSRKVLSQSADEVSSEDTPQRQAAALPGNHGNAAVRRPADQFDCTCLVVDVWKATESRKQVQFFVVLFRLWHFCKCFAKGLWSFGCLATWLTAFTGYYRIIGDDCWCSVPFSHTLILIIYSCQSLGFPL